MKKIFKICVFFLITINVFAQAPQKISYQAIIRNSSNELITSRPVRIQISILQGTSNGTAVYVENHTTATNANGLVTLEIGAGTAIFGTFATINWSNGSNYFIKTETDPNGGNNYTISGTSQMLSVPYALYALSSSNGVPGINGFVSSEVARMPTIGQLPRYVGTGTAYTTILSLTAPSSGRYWLTLYTETYMQTFFAEPISSISAIFLNGAMISQPTQNISQHNIQKSIVLNAGDVVEFKCASNLGGGYALNSFGYLFKVQ